MQGLDLETLLRFLRADVGAWISFGAILILLAAIAWTGFGSKRVLRKCLALSILIHVGLVLGGGSLPVGLSGLRTSDTRSPDDHIREIRVTPRTERSADSASGTSADGTMPRPRLADWDRSTVAAKPADPSLRRRTGQPPPITAQRTSRPASPVAPADAQVDPSLPSAPATENAPAVPATSESTAVAPADSAPADSIDLPAVAVVPRSETNPDSIPAPDPGTGRRLKPSRGPSIAPGASPRPKAASAADTTVAAVPAADLLLSVPRSTGDGPPDQPATEPVGSGASNAGTPGPDPADLGAVGPAVQPRGSDTAPQPVRPEGRLRLRPGPAPGTALARAPSTNRSVPLPRAMSNTGPDSILPTVAAGRPLPDVPEVYRPRLDPNRSTVAQRAGATRASEQAVERALQWLAIHQDADGRWDAATEAGGDDFTTHCPAGEICSGPCHYWEADTATTGLALLAYLGAGYTHLDGKHAPVVEKGLRFLLSAQKPDGDLRGASESVGMYCHSMATLALCEAYALTGDPTLHDPVERAVDFIVKSRATDGMAWRYKPGAPRGDTSILGWIILVLKSAKETGIAVPDSARDGAVRWLNVVSAGRNKGLSIYQPGYPVTATMTAEGWVCRQFLGVGGPGAASDEAAAYILANGFDPNDFNLYRWYYGTLAMYQHGGPSWQRWNPRVRDELVRRQETSGHRSGSWDPGLCSDKYDSKGGRIYCTAVATLTLEVYYRYLRLYNEPGRAPRIAPAPRPRNADDPGVRRTGNSPPG